MYESQSGSAGWWFADRCPHADDPGPAHRAG